MSSVQLDHKLFPNHTSKRKHIFYERIQLKNISCKLVYMQASVTTELLLKCQLVKDFFKKKKTKQIIIIICSVKVFFSIYKIRYIYSIRTTIPGGILLK